MASGLYYQKTTRVVDSDIEFLADEVVKDTFPMTIKDDGIEANDRGHKIVEKGSWIDKDGKKVVPTVTEDNVTFDSDPVGLLFSSVDVTYGPAFGSILYMGKVQGNWLDWGEDKEWNVKYGEAIVKILPLLRFVDDEGNMIYSKGGAGGSSSSTTVNFDLSKATGTLAIEHGGTGATTAEQARTNLCAQKAAE